jgi:hypothetical protein
MAQRLAFRRCRGRIAIAAIAFVLIVGHASAQSSGLNGSWILDPSASDRLEDVADEMNKKLNAARRKKEGQEFDRGKSTKRANRFQKQADATEELIREDSRSVDWGGPDEMRRILEAQTIKLYRGPKVVIMYDGQQKRLLTINAAGRAYSVKGTEITSDAFGRSLTYLEHDAIVIETSVYGAGKLTERYFLDQSKTRLLQALRVQEHRGGPVLELTRAFTPGK